MSLKLSFLSVVFFANVSKRDTFLLEIKKSNLSNIRKIGVVYVSSSEDKGRLIREIYFLNWIFKTASRSSDGGATNNCFISLLIARYIIRVLKEHVARIPLPSWTKGILQKQCIVYRAKRRWKKSVTRKQGIIVQAVILVYAFLVSIPTLYPVLYVTNRVFRDERNFFTLNFRRD